MSTENAGEEPSSFGPALYRVAEQEWTANGVSRGAWCRDFKLQDATVGRWNHGAEPKFHHVRAVADAIGVPMLQMLVEIGVLSESEATAEVRPTRDLHAAIRDARAPEPIKDFLLLAVEMLENGPSNLYTRRRAKIRLD